MDTKFHCEECDISFATKSSLVRHKKGIHEKNNHLNHKCFKCGKCFQVQYKLRKHEITCGKSYTCDNCKKVFKYEGSLEKHKTNCKLEIENAELNKKQKKPKKKKVHKCLHCKQTFVTAFNLNRHLKSSCRIKASNVKRCFYCKKVFLSYQDLAKHKLKCRQKWKNIPTITKKKKSFVMKVRLANKRKHNQRFTCQTCYKVFRSRKLLILHQNTVHKSVKCRKCGMFFNNRSQMQIHHLSQHGGQGNLHEVPWEEQSSPISGDPLLTQEYNLKKGHILRNHEHGNVSSTYNFPTNDLSGKYKEISDQLFTIYDNETEGFKLNMSLGMILRNTQDGSYRYFVPAEQNMIFDRPITITRRAQLRRIINKLKKLDLTGDYIRANRESTKWQPHLITNINYYVSKTGYALGGCVNLPNFIKNRRCIKSLDTNAKGQKYTDSLCLFRCLAHYLKKRDSLDTPIEVLTEQYYIKWSNLQDIPHHKSKFKGVQLSDMSKIEECFELNVYVYRLLDPGTCVCIYKSMDKHNNTMYVNLYEKHLSLIMDIDLYCHRYQCPRCDRFFKRSYNMRKHLRVCLDRTKHHYPGWFYSKSLNIFEKLEYYGIVVPKEERHYEYFLVYDFESMLKKEETNISEGTTYSHRHVPIAVGVASNVPGFTDGKCIVDEDPNEVIKNMLDYMYTIQQTAFTLAKQKWQYVLNQLEEQLEKLKPIKHNNSTDEETEQPSQTFRNYSKHKNVFSEFMSNLQQKEFQGKFHIPYNDFSKEENEYETAEKVNDDNDDDVHSDDSYDFDVGNDENFTVNEEGLNKTSNNENLENKAKDDINSVAYRDVKYMMTMFMQYITQLVCLSFNGGKYDIPLIKSLLAKHLKLGNQKTDFTIKRGSSYICISSEKLRFLDVMAYIGGGSYSQFLKAYGVLEEKGFFPYEYFTDFSKLQETQLPKYEDFYSTIKGCNVLGETEDNYIFLKDVWCKQKMKTLYDLLVWYLLADINPFCKAVINLQEFYFNRGLDVFKEFFSLPGVSRKLLFNSTDANFALFDNKHMDIFLGFKKSIFGGPSIIFNRWAKAGVTPINKKNPKELCKKILGLDLNALYLGALGLYENPTGQYVVRRSEDNFKPQTSIRYVSMYAWMDYIANKNNINILHKLNCGREKRVAKWLADGYCASSNTIYLYHGCFWHSHPPDICPITSKITNKKWKDNSKKNYQRTLDIMEYMKKQGFKIEYVFECQFAETLQTDAAQFIDAYLPPYFQKNKKELSLSKITKDILNKKLYGFVCCDIKCQSGKTWLKGMEDRDSMTGEKVLTGPIPDESMTPDEYFENFAPIFCTSVVKPCEIGDVMLQHMKQFNIPMHSRKLLVGGLSASKIYISTNLLHWYLTHGVILEKAYTIVEYTPKICFKSFQEEIYQARLDGSKKEGGSLLARTMKLIGMYFFTVYYNI